MLYQPSLSGEEHYKKKRMKIMAMEKEEKECLLFNTLPPEMLAKCAECLDIKSCIMLSNTCRKTQCICHNIVKDKECHAISEVIRQVVDLVQMVYNSISNVETQHYLMADMLRKLIFTSVTDETNTNGNSSLAHSKCVAEYNLLLDYFVDNMDITWKQFNVLLEDAQFEFRGYHLINMAEEHRSMLDEFKRRIHNIYFEERFTIHTYISLNEVDMEINFDGEQISFYVLSNYEDDESEDNEKHIRYFPDRLDLSMQGDDAETKNLRLELSKCCTTNDKDTFCWRPADVKNKNISMLLGKILLKVMPEVKNILKGTSKVTLEFWNRAIDYNWLLLEVLNNFSHARSFKAMLSNITFEHQDIFHLWSMA